MGARRAALRHVVTWFLIGGDLYTAYTFIAVPALAFGAGAMAFFAVPYTMSPIRSSSSSSRGIWHVCHKHHYITAGDFVRGRFGNRWLALAVTVTGIVATMPYIALQLVGLQVVIGALGRLGAGVCRRPAADYRVRDPRGIHLLERSARAASIAIVKDILIYTTAFAAVIVIPIELGGFGKILRRCPRRNCCSPRPGPIPPAPIAPTRPGIGLGTRALPLSSFDDGDLGRRSGHAIPGMRPCCRATLHARFARAGRVLRRGRRRGCLPEYAAGFKQFGNNFAVPALFLHSFPSWFVGIAFAAIGIGALVPAAIMSIAAANLYTRNIHREFINRNPTDKQEAQMAKWVSLIVKFGALVFIVFVPTQYAIYLQLLGGIWIIQTLPSVMLGAYTRWFNDWALLVGWAVGIAAGTAMAAAANLTPTYPLRSAAIPSRLHGALHRDPQCRRDDRFDAGFQCNGSGAPAGGRDRRVGLLRLSMREAPGTRRHIYVLVIPLIYEF